MKRIDKQTKEIICRKYQEGLSTRKIATELNIGKSSVFSILKRCGIKLRTKSEANWKGGISKQGGRIFVYDPNHILTDQNGYVKRSRLVWYQNNGDIPEGMVIHHINEDIADDRIENLDMLTRSEHMNLHRDLLYA